MTIRRLPRNGDIINMRKRFDNPSEKSFKPSKGQEILPDHLIGHVVQIALYGSERLPDWPGMIIPPLNVIGWAFEKPHYASLDNVEPNICFMGIPLGKFHPIEDYPDERFSRISGIQFYSIEYPYEPHHLLDAKLHDWIKESDESMAIGIRIYGTNTVTEFDKDFISDEYNFFYIGEGALRLFVPGKGFIGYWPKNFPWLDELTKAEEKFLEEKRRKI